MLSIKGYMLSIKGYMLSIKVLLTLNVDIIYTL
jgi:hypothetical protein